MLESPESSSPLVTRAVAASLEGRDFIPYPMQAWQRIALLLLGAFPQVVGRAIVSRYETFSALDSRRLFDLSIEQLAQARLQDYQALSVRAPAILVGAPLGGAAAHLSAALGAPFLPQAFVLTLKGGAPDGDVYTYYQRSAGLAQRIAQNNTGVLTIQHYDPIHDEWMTRRVNHLRLKLLDLPACYADFIRRHLQPGGTVIFLDCCAEWLRYRLGERSIFQVGGWGGISASEFLHGSPRIQAYARRVRLPKTDWRLCDFPLETGRESEWGSEPELADALQNFCHAEGFNFIRISLPSPHDFSWLAYRSMQALLDKEGRPPAGVLIEMFSQFDAGLPLKAGLLPVWLVFNTDDSLEFLLRLRQNFPLDKPVFFSPLATFTLTPDLVPWERWESALRGLKWTNIGTRPSHYPSDVHTLIDWSAPLRHWVRQHEQPLLARLSPSELLTLSEQRIPRQNPT